MGEMITYKLITNNEDIMNYSNNISWSSNSDALGSQLSFDSTINILDGQVVSLFNADNIELFRGVVIKKSQKRWTWNYTVQDYSFYLKNKVHVRQFNGDSASTAISSLLTESYIVGDIITIPTAINTIYKKQTFNDIILDILKQAEEDQGTKYFREIQGNILYIKKLDDMNINPNFLIPKESNIDSSIENMKNKIQVVASGEKNTSIIATAEDTSEQYWYGVLMDIEEVEEKNIAQAQNIANNKLAELNKISYSASLELECIDSTGDYISANRNIYLSIGTRFSGFYKIKSATHTLNKGTHKVSITIEW